MTKRSYKEAVEITVKWWSEKSFKTLLNQNNGDDSDNGGMMFLLMNMVSMNAKENITKEKISKFEEKLTELLLSVEGMGMFNNELSVDYSPNRKLREACTFAGINASCLPCKTHTYINDNNEIEGQYQYGGEWFTI